MKLYKKVVPYVLAGSALLMTGCEGVAHRDVIVAKQNGTIYLDRDSDGLADFAVIYDSDTTKSIIYPYAMPGDTMYYEYRSAYQNSQKIPGCNISNCEINGYNANQIKYMQDINNIRSEIGQKKTRTL